MTVSRRTKTLDISNTLFADVMRMGIELPKDFRVRDAEYDPLRDCLNFVIESKEFEKIPEASIPPPIIVTPPISAYDKIQEQARKAKELIDSGKSRFTVVDEQ